MREQGFTENDWKLFRNRIADWQEAYMVKLNQEYIKLLRDDRAASEKFWELERRIKKDKYSVGVKIEMTRARFISNILALLKEQVIGMDALDEFSDEMKERIRYIWNREYR